MPTTLSCRVPACRELVAFDVPFVLFDAERHDLQASAAATDLLAPSDITGLRNHLSVAIRCGLSCDGDSRATELSSWRGFRLMARPVDMDGRWLALVVLIARPSVPNDGAVPPAAVVLSPRERVVAALVADGESNKRIAGRLGISEHTARHHLEGVFRKLGVRSRASVASMMVRAGG